MKKTICLLAMLMIFSCTNDDTSENMRTDMASTSQKSVISKTQSKVGGNFIANYKNFSFTNDGVKTGIYENGKWIQDYSFIGGQFTVEDNLATTGQVLLKHSNKTDIVTLSNFRSISRDEQTFDIKGSNGIVLQDFTMNKAFPWAIVLEVAMWLSDHLFTSEGGTKSECSQTLSNCPNGGALTYTATTGWFGIQTGSSCSVVCY